MRACAGLEAHESSSLNSGVTMAGDVTAAARADRQAAVHSAICTVLPKLWYRCPWPWRCTQSALCSGQ
jgi:hypothetical protein